MATKLITAWINGVVQKIEVEIMDSGVQEPSIEDRLLAIEQNRSSGIVRNIALLANAWQGASSPYKQIVEIDGVTPYSKIDLQPNAEQLSIFNQKELTFLVENENGIVTVVCIGQKPMNDYIIQATITEVIVDE